MSFTYFTTPPTPSSNLWVRQCKQECFDISAEAGLQFHTSFPTFHLPHHMQRQGSYLWWNFPPVPTCTGNSENWLWWFLLIDTPAQRSVEKALLEHRLGLNSGRPHQLIFFFFTKCGCFIFQLPRPPKVKEVLFSTLSVCLLLVISKISQVYWSVDFVILSVCLFVTYRSQF